MMVAKIQLYIILIIFFGKFFGFEETCSRGEEKQKRYLVYDVNPGEGFNLRRDVYIRIANLVHKLSRNDPWVLVLPPWGNLYHWRNNNFGNFYPWETFFDIPSLNKWINVIEFEDYIKIEGLKIEEAYILQHYEEGWGGKWQEKFDERPCIDRHEFSYREDENIWRGEKWGRQLQINDLKCISIQGQASTVIPLIDKNKHTRSIYLGRSETILHDEYGGKSYWSARRSMKYAINLYKEANIYRQRFLDSNDEKDDTVITQDWRDAKVKRGVGRGGPYISVHLRRMDFIHARKNEVPSIKKAAKQINEILKKLNLTTVFVASDAPIKELEQLRKVVSGKVLWYEGSKEIVDNGGDGAVAIVDQIIASHARYFTGTHESTFSFRIREDREILGFSEDMTFNRLCGQNVECEQPAKWKIVY